MKRLSLFAGILSLILVLGTGVSLAQYNSSNYKANEVFFGTGGDNNQSSANSAPMSAPEPWALAALAVRIIKPILAS